MIIPLHQSSGSFSAFQIFWNRSYDQSVANGLSVFNKSTVMLSILSALFVLQTLDRFQNLSFCWWRTIDIQFVSQGLRYKSPLCWIWSVNDLPKVFCLSLCLFILDCDSLHSHPYPSLHYILPGIFQRGPLLFCTAHLAPPSSQFVRLGRLICPSAFSYPSVNFS